MYLQDTTCKKCETKFKSNFNHLCPTCTQKEQESKPEWIKWNEENERLCTTLPFWSFQGTWRREKQPFTLEQAKREVDFGNMYHFKGNEYRRVSDREEVGEDKPMAWQRGVDKPA